MGFPFSIESRRVMGLNRRNPGSAAFDAVAARKRLAEIMAIESANKLRQQQTSSLAEESSAGRRLDTQRNLEVDQGVQQELAGAKLLAAQAAQTAARAKARPAKSAEEGLLEFLGLSKGSVGDLSIKEAFQAATAKAARESNELGKAQLVRRQGRDEAADRSTEFTQDFDIEREGRLRAVAELKAIAENQNAPKGAFGEALARATQVLQSNLGTEPEPEEQSSIDVLGNSDIPIETLDRLLKEAGGDSDLALEMYNKLLAEQAQ